MSNEDILVPQVTSNVDIANINELVDNNDNTSHQLREYFFPDTVHIPIVENSDSEIPES